MEANSILHNYGECSYWEQRYQKQPVAFDWYQGYVGLSDLLQQVFPYEARLLQVGVGTSRLQEGMARAGWRHIDNIDYSQVVISHMAQLHKSLPQLTYKVADVRSMPEVASGSYDGLVDKGTLDAILCGAGSSRSSMMMLAECCRVLSPQGTLMCITYGDPIARLQYLDKALYGWSVEVYYIAQVQEAEEDAGVEDGCGDSAPATLLRGPFNAKQPEVMAALSQLAKVHYVYVCRKSPALIARALQAVEAQRQQEAALRAAQAGQQAGGEVGVGVGGEARGPADGEAAVVVVDRKAAQERS